MKELVILVDESDREVGVREKLDAHRRGELHRAFSIFVFSPDGKILLQKRARTKYHSDGLWSNSCCSHPRPGASIEEEAQRKLHQEMGFRCELKEIFDFIYKAEMNNDLTEYEFDHVFIGEFDGTPVPNPEEAEDWRWMDVRDLQKDLAENPERYSYWLKICIDRVLEHLKDSQTQGPKDHGVK